MISFILEKFQLTQDRLADWLGLDRSSMAHIQANRRGWPLSVGLLALERLALAARGEALLDDTAATAPAPPPLPPPAVDRDPLEWRLDTCQHLIRGLQRKLARLQQQAPPFEARLAALPALRAWTGPVPHPDLEASWLKLFEGEANRALREKCGAGPQLLLAARLAGLAREAEVLAQGLADLSRP